MYLTFRIVLFFARLYLEMQLKRKWYLAIPFLILAWSVMPILGLQSSSNNISSYGTVKYPETKLGVWNIIKFAEVPEEVSWARARDGVWRIHGNWIAFARVLKVRNYPNPSANENSSLNNYPPRACMLIDQKDTRMRIVIGSQYNPNKSWRYG